VIEAETKKKTTARVKVGSKRVSPTIAARRKEAAARAKMCPTRPKKGSPVKCRARPTQGSLAACRRAYESWYSSDEREPEKPKRSARAVCGPGVPSKKAAAYLGGKQKGPKKGSPREATLKEQRSIMAKFMRLGGK